ncbi:hypothetical protein WJX82_002711 [Trebouxia sp. C0006]
MEPGERGSSEGGGLKKYGTTCFMKAVLQLILRIRLFASELLRPCHAIKPVWGSLQKLLLKLNRNEPLHLVTKPDAQRNQLSRLLPRYSPADEHDAHEYFVRLMGALGYLGRVTTAITRPPPILMIHLARFEFQGSAAGLQGGAAKLTQKIEYPEKLDMGQYMIDGLLDRTYVLRGILCCVVDLDEVLSQANAYLLAYVHVRGEEVAGEGSRQPVSAHINPGLHRHDAEPLDGHSQHYPGLEAGSNHPSDASSTMSAYEHDFADNHPEEYAAMTAEERADVKSKEPASSSAQLRAFEAILSVLTSMTQSQVAMPWALPLGTSQMRRGVLFKRHFPSSSSSKLLGLTCRQPP